MVGESIVTGGLSAEHLSMIAQILRKFPCVERAILFGSRAKGTNKLASDIDLAVQGAMKREDVAALWAAFEESSLPFFVDVIDYQSIRNEELRAHINRVGIPIYTNEIK